MVCKIGEGCAGDYEWSDGIVEGSFRSFRSDEVFNETDSNPSLKGKEL